MIYYPINIFNIFLTPPKLRERIRTLHYATGLRPSAPKTKTIIYEPHIISEKRDTKRVKIEATPPLETQFT